MAAAVGMPADGVHRVWAADKRHQTAPAEPLQVSADPQFGAKVWDAIGRYPNPPERALVLCCDGKSQCQALELGQSACRLGPGTHAPRCMVTDGTVPFPCSRL
jgi:hypothetical protein